MEIKKSRKYDLERTRPLRLLLSMLAVVGLVGLFYCMPVLVSSVMRMHDAYDDEIIEDLNIDFDEEDDMVAAVQTEVQDEVTEVLKPVETLTEDLQKPEEMDNLDASKEQIVETETTPEEAAEDNSDMQEEKDAKPINRPDQEVLEVTEQLPEYPGGMSELVTWLTKTIRYPEFARAKKIQGEVQVSFVIEKDGSLTNMKIHKSAAPLLDREALRVCRLMKKWKPGKMKGQVCRTLFVIPVEFKL